MIDEPGYKVTVKDVHNELIKLRNTEIKAIWDNQNEICRKLDKYNGLHERMDKLAEKVEVDHKYVKGLYKKVDTAETAEQTEADVMARIKEAETETEDRTWRRVKMLGTILGIVIGFLGLLFTIASKLYL